jgi:hypothetical protein
MGAQLGQEVFVAPSGGDEYVTTDGLRGLADMAMAAGDDGHQYVKATVVRVLRKRWWQRRPREEVVDGALVLASVVVHRPAGTTTTTMAAADWRRHDPDLHRSLPQGYAPERYGEWPVPPEDAAHEAAAAWLAADDQLLAAAPEPRPEDAATSSMPAVPAAPTEELPALTGGRRGQHRAR